MPDVWCEIFAGVPMPIVQTHLIERTYRTNEVIFLQGETTTGLWVIQEGRVFIVHGQWDGTPVLLGVWGPGDVIGAVGLYDGRPYPANAVARETPTRLGWIARAEVLHWVRQYPEFAWNLGRRLSERLRHVQRVRISEHGQSNGDRIRQKLLELAERDGSPVQVTQETLAYMVGTTRETVSRILREMARKEWVRVRYGKIEILNETALRNERDASETL